MYGATASPWGSEKAQQSPWLCGVRPIGFQWRFKISVIKVRPSNVRIHSSSAALICLSNAAGKGDTRSTEPHGSSRNGEPREYDLVSAMGWILNGFGPHLSCEFRSPQGVGEFVSMGCGIRGLGSPRDWVLFRGSSNLSCFCENDQLCLFT